ncbi:MAG: polyprenyl synthetase family protein [Muribaculaceae bacterium]|nr:polyprenyl synthetase family protein [Muribaculaceae bacterium]
MKTIDEYRIEIETAIRNLKLPEGKLDNLYNPIRYALSAGGKRIRPVLTLMAADAFGQKAPEAVMPAVGLETFHNFTLLHDDVMDKSEMRRGRLTVHKKFNENTAILSGDTMLTLASQYVSQVPDNLLRVVIDAFNEMAINVYEGQQLDMDFEQQSQIALTDYIEMIQKKTGALLGTCTMIGALIGGASEKDAQKMYEFGLQTGVAFQIQDDWLDTFGDYTTFGKSIGGDINNGKKTYLYVAAFEQDSQTAKALREAYEIPAGDVRVKTVTRIYEKLGINEATKKAVNHYSSLALKALNSTSLDDEKKEVFRKLAEKLIGRKK